MSPKPQRPLPTADETAQINSERADAALERATRALSVARVAYRKAERTYAKARELAEDAAVRAARLVSA